MLEVSNFGDITLPIKKFVELCIQMYGSCLQMWLSLLCTGGRTLDYPNFLSLLLFLLLEVVFGIGLGYDKAYH